jgi:hypothetical protein
VKEEKLAFSILIALGVGEVSPGMLQVVMM